MTDTLRNIADRDTPKSVGVPQGWAGLALWALGRWGAGAVFAAACYFIYQDFRAESNRVYADNKSATVELLRAYQDQTKVNSEVAAAIERLSMTISQDRINALEVLRNSKRIDDLETKMGVPHPSYIQPQPARK